MPKLSDLLQTKFPYEPTEGQIRLFRYFDQLINSSSKKPVMIIKGYAGTGKTTVVATLVNILPLFNLGYMLLAPTGRAAKVMSGYAKKPAYTIHKIIYKSQSDPETGEYSFMIRKNYYSNTIFFIDEASMIPDEASFGSRNLLHDIFEYAFSGNNNMLVLIGDNAQLPPVGYTLGGALQASKLQSAFHVDVLETELTEVVRQSKNSGILSNATALRKQLETNSTKITFSVHPFRDVFKIGSDKLEDGLRYAYNKFGVANTVIITRSNWQAVQYNQYIRRNILFYEDEVNAGDFLMSVKNNYFWLPDDSPAGFLANGDFVEVLKVGKVEELYGLRFMTLELKMIDFSEQPSFEAKVILDTLHSKFPSLSQDENRNLYGKVSEDYADIKSIVKRKKAVFEDPYLNAIQVKFTYALTCHKSQGGQWPSVFLDQGRIKEGGISIEFIRWLYTGITRATAELYLVNFSEVFFK